MRLWGAALLGAALLTAAPAPAADEGYFLSLRQKGELLMEGSIQDAAGDWYDVLIVPGYAPPTRFGRTYLVRTGEDFAEYVSAKKYSDLRRQSHDAFEWAYKDSLVDFTLKGTPRAWRENFATASKRTDQRVFGWWFAYPWATFTSVIDNAFRIPLGLAGTALGGAVGAVGVPAYHLTDSTVKGAWHFGTGVVLVPAAGYGWNTIIAPPLSLAGQKPAPERVDGFWVTRRDAEEQRRAVAAELPLSQEQVAALAGWGRQLFAELGPYQERKQAIDLTAAEEVKAVEARAAQEREAVAAEMRQRLQELLADPARQEQLAALRADAADARRIDAWLKRTRDLLAADGDLTEQQLYQIMTLLQEYRQAASIELALRPKTDPLQQTLRTGDAVLKEAP